MNFGWLWYVHVDSSLLKNVNTLVSDVDNAQGNACVGVGNIWEISVFPS